jgi:hypothetical protein
MPTPEEDAIFRRVAAEYAARRQIKESRCAVCNTPIRGTGKRRYCSATCRQRALYYRQHPEAKRRTVTPAELLAPPETPRSGAEETNEKEPRC